MKKLVTILLILTFLTSNAQESPPDVVTNKSTVDLGVDIVSNYIWRGLKVDAVPNIQGWGELAINNLAFGSWVSTNLAGNYAETDFYTSYTINNFNATLINYFIGENNFLTVNKNSTSHVGELALNYSFTRIPLQFTVATLAYGDDDKIQSIKADGTPILINENNYSTYFELLYSMQKNNTQIDLLTGGVTHESNFYGSNGFAIINVGISLSKEIGVNENFSIPVAFNITLNPELETIYSTFKMSF